MASPRAQVNYPGLKDEPAGVHLPTPERRCPRQGSCRCKGPAAAGTGGAASTGSLGPENTAWVGGERTKAAEWPGGTSLITEETQSGVPPAFLSTTSTPPPPCTLSLGITLVPSSHVYSTTGLFHRMHRSLRTAPPHGVQLPPTGERGLAGGLEPWESVPRFTAGQTWSQFWCRRMPPSAGFAGDDGHLAGRARCRWALQATPGFRVSSAMTLKSANSTHGCPQVPAAQHVPRGEWRDTWGVEGWPFPRGLTGSPE